MAAHPSLSVIIPTFNEEDGIASMLKAAIATLDDRDSDWELIVVDNASTDRTCEMIEPFLEQDRVHLLRNPSNRGKGYSIRRGMLEATGDLRLMCDADNSPSLPSLSRMVEALDRADVVVGSRLTQGARVERQQPPRRRLMGSGFLLLTRIMMGRLARDVYNGFKLWRGEAAEAVFELVELEGWVFDAEALALAARLGYQVTEVGIEWTDRPDSRLSIRNVLLPAVSELRAARANVRRVPAAR